MNHIVDTLASKGISLSVPALLHTDVPDSSAWIMKWKVGVYGVHLKASFDCCWGMRREKKRKKESSQPQRCGFSCQSDWDSSYFYFVVPNELILRFDWVTSKRPFQGLMMLLRRPPKAPHIVLYRSHVSVPNRKTNVVHNVSICI